ncbi:MULTISPECIES: SCO family protein [Legionella]|uniref:SCO1/SenC family transporter protein n=1 Tax=Legionella steelei TaxID=947033 RepID=A0A0W0ZFU9_9GAMM|nr:MULTISPECIES: SCO family protein [Legionella]KTD67758.1 SCO1/SenC family transporter protein [Legionella steelei]MBN9226861.1 SCO family protein [Legionella steelei]OJW06591.1 MAG: photosynthetic protein synthase I [Legionella sp. 39-23]
MSLKAKSVTFTVVVLLALAGLFSGIFVGQHFHFKKKIDVSTFHGTYLENPRTVNRFSLEGVDEKSFDNKSLKGKWTLMFFGFTNCGYVCPTTMAELAKMYRTLEDKGVKNLPRIVMISIDPERDTPEKLRAYVTSFHPNFYGARGDEESIKSMTREMGIAYAKVIEKGSNDATNYDIQHSGALMLFNPNGELNAFFTTPHHADLLAKDYLLLVS